MVSIFDANVNLEMIFLGPSDLQNPKKNIRVAAGQCPQQSWPKEATGNSSLTKSFPGICVAPSPDELL